MPVAEFELIQRFFSRQSQTNPDLKLGIGDDAAIICKDNNTDYVIAVDTLNSGVHFPEDCSAEDLAYKALAVNLSDMAAMGARPTFVTLSLSLPETDEDWLQAFATEFNRVLSEYGVALIGGDTTRGPLSISVQIIGEVGKDKALLRSGAQAGDKIYVSGTLGDAALALQLYLTNELYLDDVEHNYLWQRLNRPTPRVELGLRLAGLATACIDISDGLLADLGHIQERSQCGACVWIEELPLSPSYTYESNNLDYALSGGDDYELCFTVGPEHEETLHRLSNELNIPLTCIGEIIAEQELLCVDGEGNRIEVYRQGYQHFGEQE